MSESADQKLQITNELGMHARAATKFVQTANKYTSVITVEKDGQSVNGKSIMGVLMLAAAKGMSVQLDCRGDDAPECLEELRKLIADKFGESQ